MRRFRWMCLRCRKPRGWARSSSLRAVPWQMPRPRRESIATRTPFEKSDRSSASCRRISDRLAILYRRTALRTSWRPCAAKASPSRRSIRCRKRTRRGCWDCSEMFTLDGVVPWGRSFDEYCAMFALSDRDRGLKMLDCGGGPASFNAEGTRLGHSIVSCDPLYRFTALQIKNRIDATYTTMLDQTRQNAAEFVWTSIRSVDELGAVRMSAMRTFLDDYPAGREQGRYVSAELPTLPFADGAFALALSSHFLFLYTEQFDESFHCNSIAEMSLVAGEVRVFPLLALGAIRSRHIEPVVAALRNRGLEVSIETVPYEFQKGGNQMMRIVRNDAGRRGLLTC